jgi:hypothetical protein
VVIDKSRSKGSTDPWRETQNIVTSSVGNPTIMFADEAIRHLTVRSQNPKRSNLFPLHQARIAPATSAARMAASLRSTLCSYRSMGPSVPLRVGIPIWFGIGVQPASTDR